MEEFIKTIKPDCSPYATFRDRVTAECNVTRQTFCNWAKGRPIDDKYIPIINRIAIEMFGRPAFGQEGGAE